MFALLQKLVYLIESCHLAALEMFPQLKSRAWKLEPLYHSKKYYDKYYQKLRESKELLVADTLSSQLFEFVKIARVTRLKGQASSCH